MSPGVWRSCEMPGFGVPPPAVRNKGLAGLGSPICGVCDFPWSQEGLQDRNPPSLPASGWWCHSKP